MPFVRMPFVIMPFVRMPFVRMPFVRMPFVRMSFRQRLISVYLPLAVLYIHDTELSIDSSSFNS